jgi:hypothetical protein
VSASGRAEDAGRHDALVRGVPEVLDTDGDDGRCPTCGRDLDAAARETDAKLADEKAPWHFKLLVVALVVYLGWRFVQLFG